MKVAIYYKEHDYHDDDYGKRRSIDVFESEEEAVRYLEGAGFKPLRGGMSARGLMKASKEYVLRQYHSELRASIHRVNWRPNLVDLDG